MGINKPNVRFVIHYDLPKNIESYYQEIGRAGRDGLRAHCLLLFGYGDISKINYFIDQKEDKERRTAKMHLNALVSFAESYDCRRIPLLNYFGENHTTQNCEMCDNCIKETKGLVDVTKEAQKFLSCVKRTGEIFGAMHIVDVLRGSKAQKVINNNHHNLSTYGIGKDLSKEQWLSLSRQFVQKNLLLKDFEYGSLKITDTGSELLSGNLKVSGKLMEEMLKITPQSKAELDYDKELFELLRSKRKSIADKGNVPPYVIFPDKTLIEMATYLPQSETNLRKIHGVGELKFKRYAKQFLPIIVNYCQARDNKLISSVRKKSKKKHSKKTARHIEIGESYKNSRSFEELRSKFGLREVTLMNHLTTYVSEGNKIDASLLYEQVAANDDEQIKVFKAFEEMGVNYLKPIFERLNENVTYDDLRILKVCYINETK